MARRGGWKPIVEDANLQMYKQPASERVEPVVGTLEQANEDVEMQGS
jgi:hypothetical protein